MALRCHGMARGLFCAAAVRPLRFVRRPVRWLSTTTTAALGSKSVPRVLVLGGYGEFGSRISERLHREGGLQVLVAGRDASKAQRLTQQLNARYPAPNASTAVTAASGDGRDAPTAPAVPLALDISGSEEALAQALTAHGVAVAVHTCGPFTAGQERSYRVAAACASAGVHYIDLADDRRFVSDFSGALHARAHARGVCLISGASSVPGLSSAVVDHFAAHFAAPEVAGVQPRPPGLASVDMYISPGNQTPRGLATVQSVFAYVGKPVAVWADGVWRTVYGWLSPEVLRLQRLRERVRPRLVALCDVPDLELFPARYAALGLQRVLFRAGLELWTFQSSILAMALITRALTAVGWGSAAPDWTRLAPMLKRWSELPWVWAMGTDVGGMRVLMRGDATPSGTRVPRTVEWELSAGGGDGPQIPSTPAVILAQKLVRVPVRPITASAAATPAPATASTKPSDAEGVKPLQPGAYPCMGVFSLGEFMASLKRYDISAAHAIDQPDDALAAPQYRHATK